MNNFVILNQADSWYRKNGSSYNHHHCCHCYKPTTKNSKWILVTRDESGEWFVVAPDSPLLPREGMGGIVERVPLPIGSKCLKEHPEYSIGLVPKPLDIHPY